MAICSFKTKFIVVISTCNFKKMKQRSMYLSLKSIPIFFSICIILLSISFSPAFSQNTPTISVSGSFWDELSGVDLNSTVYGIVAGEKIKLGQTDIKQRFNFELPNTIDSLVFESIGYKAVSIPINFMGSFKKRSFANLSINSEGGFSQYPSKDLFVFCQPSTHSKGMTYELFTVKKDSLFRNIDFTILIDHNGGFAIPISTKQIDNIFKVISKNTKSEVVLDTDLRVIKGLNFVDINIYPLEKDNKTEFVNTSNEIEKPKDSIVSNNLILSESLPYPTFGSRNLYFDQSKFELKSENRLILDSLAVYLKQKMNARIYVSGYTDNVGKETLNAILAKYRTQVVANYLKNKGVDESQINLDWENHNSESKKATEELNKFRKVVIEEIN